MFIASSKKQLASIGLFTATIPLSFWLDQANPVGLKGRIDHLDLIQLLGTGFATLTNVTATAVISFRILTVFYSVRKSVDPERARTYTSVVAILVESAAPCAILGIIYIIVLTQTKGGPVILVLENVVFPTWAMSLVSWFIFDLQKAC
jgi:hypothetical protein